MPRVLPIALLWMLLASAPIPAQAPDRLDGLVQALRREAPATEAFHEWRLRRALRAPLALSGTLTWQGGDTFERDVTAPYRERSRLADGTLVVQRERGGERIIPLARAPELKALFGALAALFAGDAAALRAQFDSAVEEGPGGWRLRLQPRDATLAARLGTLELRGRDDRAVCLVTRGDGQDGLLLMGTPVAGVAAVDLDGLIAGHCPGP